jgi:hypothetical protein
MPSGAEGWDPLFTRRALVGCFLLFCSVSLCRYLLKASYFLKVGLQRVQQHLPTICLSEVGRRRNASLGTCLPLPTYLPRYL